MYYVELNGYDLFEGSLADCKRFAKIVRKFLTKYKYYPVDSNTHIRLDSVFSLSVSMFSIEF